MRIFEGAVVAVTVILFVARCPAATSVEDEDLVTTFTNEIRNWTRTGHPTKILNDIIADLAIPDELERADWRTLAGPNAALICNVCRSVANAFISLRKDGESLEAIQDVLVSMCAKLNIQTHRVCLGAIELNMPIFLYIVDKDPTITSNDFCGIALQSKECSTSNEKYEWKVKVDSKEPKKIGKIIAEDTAKIVQITDIHYDPLYEVNGNANCDEPTCCRKGQNSTNSDKSSGFWGDYNYCDTPWTSVVDALDHIREEHRNIDYVYFTGDIIDHGVWETTREGNIESLTKSYDKIKETFGNTPVFPILGNHEPNPLNVFAPNFVEEDEISTKWLYEFLADLWIDRKWLPESCRETILRGGFYTVSPRKGFRIIVLNSNVCYTFNWWLVLSPQDPSGQLQWLADILLESEKNNEFVHILSHIPSGSPTCYKTWSREYVKIINRFSNVVTAQFNGHTHFDEFNLFYDQNNHRKAINVAWNGGSLTAYSNLNPNYKIYTAHSNTFEISEIDTWMYNLTEANETPEKRPRWFKSYSFKKEYDLDDISPAGLNNWIIRASRNIDLLNVYNKNFHKNAEPALKIECDGECLKKHLCNIVTSIARDEEQCKILFRNS